MRTIDGVRTEFGLPPISQIGVVVRDMDKAVQHYFSIFGIGPFNVYELVPEKHWYKERPSYLRIRQGKASWGEIEFELMQPLAGESVFRDFLESHGDGVHHLGFNVPNYDEMLSRFKEAGFRPLMRVETYVETYEGHLRACCFDTNRLGGIFFEIIWKSWLMNL